MKRFEVQEDTANGNPAGFAVIEARSARSALNKAARQFPRWSDDYCGYVGPVTWRAFEIVPHGSPEGDRADVVLLVKARRRAR